MKKEKFTTFLAYSSYRNMMRNCYPGNETNGYEENNIIVCDEWRNNFEQFLKDMGNKPTKEHKLCRIDKTKNYSPENCVWALKSYPSNTVWITYSNKKQRLIDFCKKLDINYFMVYNKLRRNRTKTQEEIIKEICQGLK